MRPETFNRKMNHAIARALEQNDYSQLKSLVPRMKKQWLKYARDEGDFRSGEEVYGYDTPLSTLTYISDRWRCSFRLRWIMDGITSGKLGSDGECATQQFKRRKL